MRKNRSLEKCRRSRPRQTTGKLEYIYFNTGNYSWSPHTSFFDIIENNFRVLHPSSTSDNAKVKAPTGHLIQNRKCK